MYKNLRTKDGQKLYAVCSWQENQHKVYNAYTRALNSLDDLESRKGGVSSKELDAAYDWIETMEEAVNWINNVMDDGLVYAPWKWYKILKDIIGAYDLRH